MGAEQHRHRDGNRPEHSRVFLHGVGSGTSTTMVLGEEQPLKPELKNHNGYRRHGRLILHLLIN